MKNLIYPIIFVCFTFTSIEVLSDTDKAKKGPFSGNLNIGFSKLSGNVDTETLNYGLLFNHKKGVNKLIFKVNGNESQVNDNIIKKDMLISLLDIYNFNKISAVYGKVSYLENEFIGYNYLAKLGMGYLHTFLDDDKKKFSTRLGFQARQFEEATSGHTDNPNFLLVGCRGSYPIMKNILIKTEVNYEVNFENKDDYESDAEVGFTFKVNKTIDLELSYKVQYYKIPKFEKERTDRNLVTKLVYNF